MDVHQLGRLLLPYREKIVQLQRAERKLAPGPNQGKLLANPDNATKMSIQSADVEIGKVGLEPRLAITLDFFDCSHSQDKAARLLSREG